MKTYSMTRLPEATIAFRVNVTGSHRADNLVPRRAPEVNFNEGQRISVLDPSCSVLNFHRTRS